jgi:hypothetical protein
MQLVVLIVMGWTGALMAAAQLAQPPDQGPRYPPLAPRARKYDGTQT